MREVELGGIHMRGQGSVQYLISSLFSLLGLLINPPVEYSRI